MQAPGEEPEFTKTWKFQGRSGAVDVMLTKFSNGPTSLHIWPEESSSVSEEAGFLSEVFEDLQSIHFDVRSIGWISLRLKEPDAGRKVASYAVSSVKWKQSLKTRNPAIYYPLVTRFLNESGAYSDWQPAFQRYGLSGIIAGVEKVALAPFPSTHATCPPGRSCQHLLVPIDALIQMNLIPYGPSKSTAGH